MKRYGYHRTSTKEQHLDRGIIEIQNYCSSNNLELEKIFTDQQTGKNFNRPRYQVLKEDVLRSGDELIITEVDRLGRNKQETLKELQYYRDNNIRVKILELPTTLMDISKLDNAMARMLMEKSVEQLMLYLLNPNKGKIGLVNKIEDYEVYALTWDDIFKSFELRHASLLKRLKYDREKLTEELMKEIGDEEGRDKVNALTNIAIDKIGDVG